MIVTGRSVLGRNVTHGTPRNVVGGIDTPSANAHTPSLVVLDLMMEDREGFEAALRLEDDPRTCEAPIVVLSSRELSAQDRQRLRGKVPARVRGAGDAQLAPILRSLRHGRAETRPVA